MLITIGDKTKEHMNTLRLKEYPFTSTQIKGNYRKLLLEYHPDHNKNGEGKTRKIISAYKAICFLAIDIDEKTKNDAQTKIEKGKEDLFTFFEDCPKCSGRGYFTQHSQSRICKCSYGGFSLFSIFSGGKCISCKGTGKFKQRRSKRIVRCRECKGTGICPICNGKRFVDKGKKERFNCSTCRGTGKIEIKPFNPVIPKGAVL